MECKCLSTNELKRLEDLKNPISNEDLAWLKARIKSLNTFKQKVERDAAAMEAQVAQAKAEISKYESMMAFMQKQFKNAKKGK